MSPWTLENRQPFLFRVPVLGSVVHQSCAHVLRRLHGLCASDPHYFPLLLSIDKWTPNHICSDTSDSRDQTLFLPQPPERSLACTLSDLGPPSLSCQKELRQELINLRLPSAEALQSPEAPHQLCTHRMKYQPV